MRSLTRVGLAVVALAFWMTGAMAEDTPATPMADGPVADRSLVCMIDDNLQRQPGIEYAYNGKTYYLCCMGCVNRFSSDPERFSHATDPVSGEPVDKAKAPIYAYAGRAFFFSNEEHLNVFAGDPGRFLQQPPAEGACDGQSRVGCQAAEVEATPSAIP